MDEGLFENYDEPLNEAQVVRLLRRMEKALHDDTSWLPEQEIQRLWYGTWDSAEPLKSGIAYLYNELLDWQENQQPLKSAHARLVRQVAVLLKSLDPHAC